MGDFAALPGNRADNQAIKSVVVSGNTLGTSGSMPRHVLSINATGQITAGFVSGSLRLSVTAPPLNLSAGTTSNALTAVTFSNSNGVSFGLNGSTVTGSIATSLTNVNVSAGTTSNNLSAVVFSNSNNVSFGIQGSTVTASATVAATAETPFGLSAGTQSVSTGTLVFSDSNGVTFGMSGSSRVTASISSVVFSNSNNVSFGLNAGTLTATATVAATAETPFGVSAGTQSVSTGTLVFSNSNNVSFGMSGSSRVTASASFAAETPFGVSAGTQSVSTGTLIFSDSNGVTFGMSGSSRVTASISSVVFSNSNNVSFGINAGTLTATATVAATAETPFGVSAGTQSVSTGTLVFSDSNGISFGMSGSSRITASYTVPTETPFGVSAGTQSVSTGTLVFSNSNNVSFGMSGSSRVTATASFPAETPFGVSAGTQSISTGTLIFSDSNGVTFGMSGSSRVTASFSSVVFSNSNNVSFGVNAGTLTATATALETPFGVSAGTQSVSTGTLVFSNSNNVSFGMSGSSRVTASASYAAETPFGVSAGTQSISTGTLIFSDSNGISFGMSGSSRITASYTVPTVTSPVVSNAIADVSTATGSGTGVTQFAAHDHVHRGIRAIDVNGIASTFFGNFDVSGGSLIALSTGGNTTAGSVAIHNLLSSATTVSSVTSANVVGAMASRFALEGHQHAGVGPFGVSNIGNTAGDTGTQFGRVVLAGTNITLSVSSSNNGAQTITISAGAGGGAGYTAGVSTGGNTAGDTGVVTGRLVLAATNNLTLSGSTNAGSMTVTLSGPTGGGMGVSTGGSTAGSTGTVGAQVVFVGTDNVYMSQSTLAGGSATITVGLEHESRFINEPAITQAANSIPNASHVSICPFLLPVVLDMSALRFGLSINPVTTTNTSSAYFDLSASAVLYSRNVSTLSSIVSGSVSRTGTWQSDSGTVSVGGARDVTMSWNASTVLKPGYYWLALHISTANSATGGANTTALGNSISMMVGAQPGTAALRLDPFFSATNATHPAYLGLGVVSTGATRATLAFSAITQTGTLGAAAKLWLEFRNYSLW